MESYEVARGIKKEKPNKKTNTVWFHLYKAPRIVKLVVTENRMVVAKGWGKREMGNYYLTGKEFQFGKMKKFCR